MIYDHLRGPVDYGVFLTLLCEAQGDKPTAGPLIKGAQRFIRLSIAVCLARRVWLTDSRNQTNSPPRASLGDVPSQDRGRKPLISFGLRLFMCEPHAVCEIVLFITPESAGRLSANILSRAATRKMVDAPGLEQGGISQPLFSCQGKPSLGLRAYTAPPYPPSLLSHCLNLLGQGHTLHSVAKVEYVRRKPKLKEVFVRLEDHLECVCTSQHHVVEHSDAETGHRRAKGKKRKPKKLRPSKDLLAT
ncbi:hypothetical protein KUCAC02_007883 [Chaenocephalus aceratus]|uniref:Uncharacterized protein n=1 Tax=Chaenocephalus aceratus TaxID=36190 RepID=A0ACB9X8M7_CHAAC|nr:hypothetical protein KUCAC02_007883 [Chaenocephalus aceratus]